MLLVTTLLCGTAFAAPKPPRPEAGIGVLLVRPALADRDGAPPALVLYREPGVGRLGEWSAPSLPLFPLPVGDGDLYPLAVVMKRGEWFRVAYDEAGRSGWVERQRNWSFLSWEEYLKGRSARLLPGLRKPYCILRSEPTGQAPELRTLSPSNALRIVEVAGDRARVLLDLSVIGWLQWRDEDGRLLIGLR